MTLVYGSLFAGAGGFDLGFEAAGWHCAWMVEIDQTCQAVLRRHWPDVPAFGDVRDCGATNLAPVDAIVFGSPCQDLSVAGKRAGFEGERSGLFHEAIRIIRELRPTWAVWENVPGALSSVRGRDFGAALDALADSGALDIAWRVLDAQFWGVAQRRRRVFVVADFRGERAGEVLFESESVRRDSQTGGTAREGVAGTLGTGSPHRGFGTGELDGHGAYVPVAGTQRSGQRGTDDPDRQTFVAAAVAIRGRDGGSQIELGGDVANAVRSGCGSASRGGHVLAGAVSAKWAKGTGGPSGDEAYNLVAAPVTASYGHDGRSSPRGDGSEPLVATFQQSSLAGRGTFGYDENATVAKPVKTQSDGQMIVGPAAWDGAGITGTTNRSSVVPGAPAPTLNGAGLASLASPAAVRRLTPRECERLQGWPDDFTRYRDDGTAIADGPRYRMIGNGVVAPLARWLAERLAAAQKEGYPPERSVTTPNIPRPRPAERSTEHRQSRSNLTNAAAPDHLDRSWPDLDDASADRGTPMPQRRAEMTENLPCRPDPSSASPAVVAPSESHYSASGDWSHDG